MNNYYIQFIDYDDDDAYYDDDDTYYDDDDILAFKYQGRQYSDDVFDEMFCE